MSNGETMYDLLVGMRRMLEDQWLEPLKAILGTTKMSLSQIKAHLLAVGANPKTTRTINSELAKAVLAANTSRQHLKNALEELDKLG